MTNSTVIAVSPKIRKGAGGALKMRFLTRGTVGRAPARVIAAGVEPPPRVSTRGLRAKFDPSADDGTASADDPEGMITNSIEVAATAATARGQDAAIAVRGVRKNYGSVQALDGVDLTVRRGEVLALLGPNGAGKTSLVEILEGHRIADAGEINVLGHDPAKLERAFRERVGIVLQEEGLEEHLTVREMVELYGAAYPNPRPADEIIELVGLTEQRDKRAGTLSGGQRRRLDLAVGICGDPELIFLDEPTTGFDPAARRRSWELISDLKDLGKTILLTTHYMEEAQRLADRVVVISAGRVIAEGTPDTLVRGNAEAAVVTFRIPAGFDIEELPLPDVERSGDTVSFQTKTPTADLAPLLSWATVRGVELEGLAITRPTLEDVYLQLTQEPA
jgi:ABC-2 type transport system ATP-binding protein